MKRDSAHRITSLLLPKFLAQLKKFFEPLIVAVDQKFIAVEISFLQEYFDLVIFSNFKIRMSVRRFNQRNIEF